MLQKLNVAKVISFCRRLPTEYADIAEKELFACGEKV
jgi:hypothetical protein